MDTVERAIRWCAESWELQLRADLDRLVRSKHPPESKIEEAFAVALISLGHATGYIEFPGIDIYIEASPEAKVARQWHAEVYLQEQVLDYRADFLLKAFKGGLQVGAIVVECDGHDYHERTKLQAQRDRSRDRQMTVAGFQVLRFTGSEIYQDCIKVALEAVIAAKKLTLAD